MRGTLAAKRYAKALLALATQDNQIKEIASDMQLINTTLNQSRDLSVVLKSPVIKSSQKLSSLNAIFKDVNKYTAQLFKVLIDNKRIPLLHKVAEVFVQLVDEINHVVTAKVTTAVPMTDDIEKEIMAKIKAMTKSETVKLTKSVDEKLIGGFLLRIGDLEYDASIANKLNNLKYNFKRNSYA